MIDREAELQPKLTEQLASLLLTPADSDADEEKQAEQKEEEDAKCTFAPEISGLPEKLYSSRDSISDAPIEQRAHWTRRRGSLRLRSMML